MAEGDNSFEEDPPNAVLAFLETGGQAPEDAVVVDQATRVWRTAVLSYSIDTLEGVSSRPDRARHAVHRPVRAAAVRQYRCAACDGASGDASGDGSRRPRAASRLPHGLPSFLTSRAESPPPPPARADSGVPVLGAERASPGMALAAIDAPSQSRASPTSGDVEADVVELVAEVGAAAAQHGSGAAFSLTSFSF